MFNNRVLKKLPLKKSYVPIKYITINFTAHSIKYRLLCHIFMDYSYKELNYIWK